MTDLSRNPRFVELPKHFQDEIAKAKPTGFIADDTWHEVQFSMGNIFCQAAVVNGKYVALLESEVLQFTKIIKIFSEDDLR